MNPNQYPQNILDKIESFNREYAVYMERKTLDGQSYHRFICQKSFQFNVDLTQVDVIKTEVYLRSRKAIENGKTINNLSSWIRSCALNIIREERRFQEKITQLDLNIYGKDKSSISDTNNSMISQEETDKNYQRIKDTLEQALRCLSELERKLILLKDVDDLSWQEIHQQIDSDYSIDCLKQRKCRARPKLRRILEKNTPCLGHHIQDLLATL